MTLFTCPFCQKPLLSHDPTCPAFGWQKAVPCLCGKLIDGLPGNLSHCFIHHENEPVPDDVYLVCGECFHVYATAQDLINAYERVTEEMGSRQTRPADEIMSCPHCVHDF